jgi:hypothetical protein
MAAISAPAYNNESVCFFRPQLTFDSFTLGRFTSWTQAGCPDGDLQISESPLERPQVGGRWCGTAWGPPAIYYR